MSLIRKHVAVLQAWACLDLVILQITDLFPPADWCSQRFVSCRTTQSLPIVGSKGAFTPTA